METPHASWIDHCTMHLGRLRPDAPLEACASVAEALWLEVSDFEPRQAAEMALLRWLVRSP